MLLDATVARGLLARAAELRSGHDLDVIGRRTPTATNRLDVFGEHRCLVDVDVAGQAGVPELTGPNRADHIKAGQVAAVTAAQT